MAALAKILPTYKLRWVHEADPLQTTLSLKCISPSRVFLQG
jgi:hypothetical protein